jgi:hypothetical protein
MSINRAIQRLMVLDAIVEDPDLVWLAPAEDKSAHLTAITSIASADLPHAVIGEGDARKVRYFPERLPIGIHLAGRGVIVYVFGTPDLDGFRVFVDVRLLDSSNYSSYKSGRQHRYIGGLAKRSPVRLQIPHAGTWYVVIDMQGLRGSVRSSARVLPGPLPPIREAPLSSMPSPCRVWFGTTRLQRSRERHRSTTTCSSRMRARTNRRSSGPWRTP